MDKLFGKLKNLLQTKNAVLDDMIFRLHYRTTFVMLMAASIMVTAKSYFGDPINCITKDDVPEKVLNTFCWIHTTFSIEKAWKKTVDVQVPYPGVDHSTNPNDKKVYHAYYQWVCVVLFLQALLFYLPRAIWKNVEGGRIKNLIKGLDSSGTKDSARKKLVTYLVDSVYSHRSFFCFYILLEILNFVNVVIQMVIMDEFLSNEFTTYGLDVIRFTDWDWSIRYDPMLKVFPRMTKCTFHRYGSSGDVMKYDSMCLLPVNIINEKIYIFLWFWFYFVAILTLIGLIYRLVTIFSPRVRFLSTFSRRPIKNTKARDQYRKITENCGRGTWFFLDILSMNMSSTNFKDTILDFSEAVGIKASDDQEQQDQKILLKQIE